MLSPHTEIWTKQSHKEEIPNLIQRSVIMCQPHKQPTFYKAVMKFLPFIKYSCHHGLHSPEHQRGKGRNMDTKAKKRKKIKIIQEKQNKGDKGG